MTYAAEIELIDRVPGIKRLKIDERQVVFLDFAPYEDLVEASRDFDPKWQVAIMLAGDAGLRLGEIRAIGAQHWDRWRSRITVERSLWENIESATKGWRRRTIPLTDRLQAALLEVEKSDSKMRSRRYLFGPSQNKAPTDEVMNTRMEWIRDRAGIAGIGWHALRHTFCSHLAMLGVPARTIQELAGHADLRTTLQYMHLVECETDRAISLLNGRPKRAQEQRDRAESGHSEPEKAGSSPRGDDEE